MPDPFGLSFMPGAEGKDPNNPQPTPVQQAIQTLSLRIPRVVGAGSIAPGQLLNGAGGFGNGSNPNAAAILEEIRRRLFGGNQSGAPSQPPHGQFGPAVPHPPPPGAPPSGGLDTPRIIPGDPPNSPREAGPADAPYTPPNVPDPMPMPGPPMRGPRERQL